MRLIAIKRNARIEGRARTTLEIRKGGYKSAKETRMIRSMSKYKFFPKILFSGLREVA